MEHEDDDDGRELTPHERSEFRRMLEREKRVEWIWSSFRVWAVWITAVGAAYYFLMNGFKDIMKWLAKGTTGG